MKNAKRWLAVILAVTLLGSNAIYQLGTTLSANETEAVTESQQDESENAVAVQEGTQQEDTGKATVQEVTPQEDKSDASAQESKPVQEEQQTAAVEAPQAEQTQQAQEAAPANAGQSEPEAQAETPVLQTYDVKINKPDLDGGQIKVWGTDGIQTDVTSYDGNNQYVKEVTEGEDFNFQITRNDGFEIENVTVNGAQIAPESTDGNVSTYKLSGVAEEKAITITYNKVETPVQAGENQDSQVAGDEEQKDDANAEANTNAAIATYAANENVVGVGKTITLTGAESQYTISWSSDDNTVATVTGNGNIGTVKGVKEGSATITYTYWKWVENNRYGNWDEKTESWTVTVTDIPSIKISGADSVYIDQDITLSAALSGGATGTVEWSSSDPTVASVDQNGKVTGIRKGTVTIYAALGATLIASKQIEVKRDESNGQYVYLYTKVTGDTTGLVLNKDGWYTIGKLWVPGMPSAGGNGYTKGYYYKSGAEWDAVQNALANPNNFERYGSNTSIEMSSIDWNQFGLIIADGATNYVGTGKQWHLDGMSNVTNYGSVTINHYLEGTTQKLAESETVNAEEGTVINAANYKKNITGYIYTSANPEQYTIVKRSFGIRQMEKLIYIIPKDLLDIL